MDITLHLKPELGAGLLAQAQAGGKTLEEYLLSMVESAVTPAAAKPLSPQERADAFEKWAAGHRYTPLFPITPSAVNRSMKAATPDERPD